MGTAIWQMAGKSRLEDGLGGQQPRRLSVSTESPVLSKFFKRLSCSCWARAPSLCLRLSTQ